MLSTTLGILVFLGFLFFAVQLMYNLFATSTVTATAYDAARKVATSGAKTGGEFQTAENNACREMTRNLGGYGKNVTCDWSQTTADTVQLHVHADNPSFILFFSATLPFTHLDRTVTVRVEKFQ